MSFEHTDPNDLAVYPLARRAQRALRHGDHAGAEQACLELLAQRPDHPDALQWLATYWLATEQVVRAAAVVVPAAARTPGSAPLQLLLAHAQAEMGEFEAARSAYARCFELDRGVHLALFGQGRAAGALGRREEMLSCYVTGLELARYTPLLAPTTRLPPHEERIVADAINTLQDARLAAYEEVLAPLRARHGATAIRRIQEAVEANCGKRPLVWPHPLQRPTFLLIPDLPPQPWFESSQFPFLAEVEASTDMVLEELKAVLAQDAGMAPYIAMSDNAPAAPVWRELNRSPRWSGYHFFRHGERVEENCRRCPNTAALLERLPIMRIEGHSPEALFSVLRPRTRIPIHTGVANGRLTVHLPLIIPENCGALGCGGIARPWRMGQCLVFDDSMAHEAWNDSDYTRVVLIFDIWNPYLTPVEREANALAVAAIGRFKHRYLMPGVAGHAS